MNTEARVILDENILGSVATVNADGSPWATPVHVFSDSEAVYWFSHDDRQHSRNIEQDARVSLVLFSPDESRGPKGVYINGTAEKLDEAATEAVKQTVVLSKLGTISSFFDSTFAYRLQIGTLNSSKSFGNCWYFYT